MLASPMTYKRAGVDVLTANRTVKTIARLSRKTLQRGVVSGIGGFAALFDSRKRFPSGVLLAASTDGVGTKIELAELQDNHKTIGIDLVAMSVNDLVTVGAEPLFFLDYFATGRLNPRYLNEVIRGIVAGCQMSDCALIGGETAEMPDFYQNGRYDLAGFAVGAVRKKDIPRPGAIRAGDAVLGLASSGVHSNGFSLIRKIFSQKELKGALGRKLLRPTAIYVRAIRALRTRVKIKGLAHITGGGFYDNIPRVLPKGLGVTVYGESWPVPDIFLMIQRKARIGNKEMFHTFNMGVGMVAILWRADVKKAQRLLQRMGVKSWNIGIVRKGSGVNIL